jgi:hypothetical protein
MRRTLVPVLLLVAWTSAALAAGDAVVQRLTRAGVALAQALGDGGPGRYGFEDEERFDLRLAPFRLDGLALRDMSSEQRANLWQAVDAPLSSVGREKIRTIMSLEREVARAEREAGTLGRLAAWAMDRDPEAYYLTLYGEPGSDAAWGYRFDGHHVSLNVTAVPGELPAVTPLFLGGQPRRVPEGWERAGLQVLAEQEDLARSLYSALDSSSRVAASLPYAGDRDLMLGTARRMAELPTGRGVARADLVPAQQASLNALLESYLGLLDPELAAARRAEIDLDGRDEIRFAWAGDAQPGAPHYYRLQGPSFLIEFDNTLEGADHIHVVWRDPRRDYGMDLLDAHRSRAH